MQQVQNCFEYTLKRYTFENLATVLAVVYVLLGRGGYKIKVRWKS